MFDSEATTVIGCGQMPGLKLGYVVEYWEGMQSVKEGSTQPLLGTLVLSQGGVAM